MSEVVIEEMNRLIALAEACAADRCADESEQDRRLLEFHSELEPEMFLEILRLIRSGGARV